MRLIYISQTCPPEPGATKRPLKQARVLKELGHDVTLITAFPNYPMGTIPKAYRGKLWAREVLEGVDVIRVWCVPARNRGMIRRVIGFVTFSVSATFAGLRLAKSDAVISSVPKPFTEMAGWIIARLRGSSFVIELRDLLPDSLQLIQLRETSFVYRLLKVYYGWIYRRADLFAVSAARTESQLADYGVKRGRCVLLDHAVDFDQQLQNRRHDIRRGLGLENNFVVGYAGSFSAYYGVPSLLEAARQFKGGECSRIKLLLVGTGPDFDLVKSAVEAERLDNVILTGGIAPDEVYGYLQAADVLIHPQTLAELMDSTKIIEYIASGRPVINRCDKPELREAENLGIGLSVGRDDTQALVDAIIRLASDDELRERCGKVGREISESKYDRRQIVARFAKALEDHICQRFVPENQR